jgi:hypothetical protein
MKLERYFNRFHLISALDPSGLIYFPVANASAIRIGYMVGNSSGYAAEITSTQETAIPFGIAATANSAAEAAGAGAVSVGVIPLLPQYRFAVPVGATDLITQAQVGLIYDLQAANNIDEGDAITFGYGFRVDAIDVSAEAIAANTFGFAIGHFQYIAAS